MSIIAISGKMQSGKNTIASIIQYLTSDDCSKQCLARLKDGLDIQGFHNSHWKQVAFADKLKQIVSILTGISVQDLEKQEVKNRVLGEEWLLPQGSGVKDQIIFSDIVDKPYTVRQLLQKIGTNAMRNVIHPNIWVNALFADYKPNGIPYKNLGDLYDDLKHIPSETKLPNWIITDVRFPNELQAIKDRGGVVIRVNKYDITGQGKLNPHTSETALDNTEFDYVIDNNGTIKELIEKVKLILIKERII